MPGQKGRRLQTVAYADGRRHWDQHPEVCAAQKREDLARQRKQLQADREAMEATFLRHFGEDPGVREQQLHAQAEDVRKLLGKSAK
ncbi:hypothetical protein HRD49_39230 [Corallococcus exiguus]|uniref:hypothetical protein n=1 Tax=Corallococcus exiguus TaxID=83462 RepID=UPI0015600B50|nr:hypothetical protein [Corallococcus exiguus]NRD67779.1 hypothetical protein [Corallococcus exiguus]